jgi:hypothetical protein
MVLLAFSVGVASAAAVDQQWARFGATCGETITTGQAVVILDADGLAYKADANDATLRPAVGVAGKGCATDGSVEIITQGIFSGYASLSESAPVYLSETAGALTQSAPSYAQQLGVAISATQYYINPQNYLDTSALTALGVLTGATPISLEGATADAYETTIAVTDPTADRTVTLPDATGTVAMVSGAGAAKSYALDTDNVVLAAADCGEVHAIATDAKTYTLPATIAGCQFTLINAGAAANNIIEIVPNAADQVFGTVTLAASVVVIAGAAGEHVLNTKASSQRGDSLTLIGDGADGWYILSSTGIWAEATP